MLQILREHSLAAMNALAAADPIVNRVYSSYRDYAATMADWQQISEGVYSQTRRPG